MGGGEFTVTHFHEYFAELGVRRELTAPYTPQQNGVVERRNQTVVRTAQRMLKVKNLSGIFWGEAVTAAVYTLNHTTMKGNSDKTPYEPWVGCTPGVRHLHMFGCVTHVKTTSNLKKLDDRSKSAIFIRYEPGSKAYHTYDLATQRVRISCDVVFEEEAKWDWASAQPGSEFVINYVEVAHLEVVTVHQNVPEVIHDRDSTSLTPSPVAGPQGFGSPPLSPASSALDADHDDAPVRYRSIRDIMKDTDPGKQGEDLLMVNMEELVSFQEAQAYDCWRKVMLDGMTAIEANNTWELVEAPASQRPIGLKWVFKTKKDASGVIVKHKACVVVKGYVQQPGIDFDEVFAPMAQLETVRMLLAYTANKGWAVHHMDVKSTFLNEDLQEEVFVTQLPGFIIDGAEHKVLRLSKALYGLR
jgi:hypothetical protein